MPGLDPCVTAPNDSQSSGGHAGHWSGQPTPGEAVSLQTQCSGRTWEGPARSGFPEEGIFGLGLEASDRGLQRFQDQWC